jgi:hypothetical protein
MLPLLLLSIASSLATKCSDLATNDTYDLSFEGSWTYRTLDPVKEPLNAGKVGFSTYSDRSPSRPLWVSPLALSVLVSSSAVSCVSVGYEWRPDFAVSNATCAWGAEDSQSSSVHIEMAVAYQSNATICTRYTLQSPSSTSLTLVFTGEAPPADQPQMQAAFVRAGGGVVGADLKMAAYADYAGSRLEINRTWAVRADLPAESSTFAVNATQYSWQAVVPAGGKAFSATVCVTETQPGVDPAPSDVPPAKYDPPPPHVTSRSGLRSSRRYLRPGGGQSVWPRAGISFGSIRNTNRGTGWLRSSRRLCHAMAEACGSGIRGFTRWRCSQEVLGGRGHC